MTQLIGSEAAGNLEGVRWSVLVQPLGGEPWIEESADRVVRTASVGKCLLLSEVARQIRVGTLDPTARIAWQQTDFVRDSGLWHTLDQRELSVLDLCRLIGAVSDNLATNALLRTVGQPVVQRLADQHDLAPMTLLDQVRDDRDPTQPGVAATLSRASARAAVHWLMLSHAGVLDREPLEWLRYGCDLSMVAAAFGLDPIGHAEEDRGIRLLNKTGTIDTVRADIGLVDAGGQTLAYAVLADWGEDAELGEQAAGGDPRDAVLARMALIGRQIRDRLRN